MNTENDLVPKDSRESWYKGMSGTENEDFASLMAVLCGAACHAPVDDDSAFSFQSLVKALSELHPQDAVEAMLLSRAFSLHQQGMLLLARGTDDKVKNSHFTEVLTNLALKMFKVQNETIETLSRWRRKGEQRITVQTVRVEDGGQAIVGGSIGVGGKA